MQQEPNHKHFTRGGQISFHNLRMWEQIVKSLLTMCSLVWIVAVCGISWYRIQEQYLTQAFNYYLAKLFDIAGLSGTFQVPYNGHIYRQSVHAMVTNPYYQKVSQMVLNATMESIWWATMGTACFAIISTIYFIRKGRLQTKHQFIRGSQIQTPKIVAHQIKKEKMASDITIDKFPLIKNSEVQHLLVHGTVGTGKSQLIMKILDAIRQRGDRAIIYDKGCAFISAYFQDGKDKVLNPFDARCPNWDLWLEAPQDTDLENMAESLIPMHGESDPFWVNAARTVFVSAASRMRHDEDRSIEKLLKLLLTGEFENLEKYLEGTPAATLVSGKIEKTAISIRSVITTYLKSFQALSGLESQATTFSIRDYVLNEDNEGWLFISSNGGQHKSLKPLISMWLAMASLTILSLEPDSKRRIWFICDELPTLHKLPLLGETIAEVRKFGGCFLLGMQSFSQLEKVYGRSGAQEIFDLLNTRFFFRSPSSDMARLVSRELGEEEIEEPRENYSYGANSIRDGISLGNNRVTRPVVAYPQVLELMDLNCFIRLPGQYPTTQLHLKLQKRASEHLGYIERINLKNRELIDAPSTPIVVDDDECIKSNNTNKQIDMLIDL
jgi:type IV conjugative transfer system coupling protein TraD